MPGKVCTDVHAESGLSQLVLCRRLGFFQLFSFSFASFAGPRLHVLQLVAEQYLVLGLRDVSYTTFFHYSGLNERWHMLAYFVVFKAFSFAKNLAQPLPTRERKTQLVALPNDRAPEHAEQRSPRPRTLREQPNPSTPRIKPRDCV